MKSSLLFPIFFLQLILSCTTQLSGPSTEQGNPQIVAYIVDSLNRPAVNIPVYVLLASSQYDSTDNAAAPSSATRIAAAKSDKSGKCSFFNLLPGYYHLEASDDVRQMSVLSGGMQILSNSGEITSDTLVLRKPGTVEGTVTRGGIPGNSNNADLQDGFIQVKIKELDRFFITGADGSYHFSDLPGGAYTFYYYASDGFYTAIRKLIEVTPGTSTLIDTVRLKPVPRLLPPSNFNYLYDSPHATVYLEWSHINLGTFRYYEIERISDSESFYRVWKTTDTLLTDTLINYPERSSFSYVIHTVDSAFNKSMNAGPIEIVR